MEPIITSNSYSQTLNEYVKLYWEETFRKYYIILILLFAAVVWRVVYSAMNDTVVIGLINLVMIALVVLFIRYRFISTLRKNTYFQHSRVLKVFDNRLEVEENGGVNGVVHLTEIASVKALKFNYRVRMYNKQVFWIPMSCFKSETDMDAFEEVMRSRA